MGLLDGKVVVIPAAGNSNAPDPALVCPRDRPRLVLEERHGCPPCAGLSPSGAAQIVAGGPRMWAEGRANPDGLTPPEGCTADNFSILSNSMSSNHTQHKFKVNKENTLII